MERLKDEHAILVGKGGRWGNALRIKPPMCFSAEDADYLADALDESLSAL